MNREFLGKSVIFFAGILLISCVLGTLFPSSLKALGMMALLWGMLMAGVLLWLEERLAFLKAQDQGTSKRLPERLISGLDRQSIYDQGIGALKGLNRTVLFVLLGGGLYILAGVYTLFSPSLFEPLLHLQDRLGDYFSLQSVDVDIAKRQNIDAFRLLFAAAGHIMPLFIIGGGFWLCQVYAYGSRAQSVLLWISGLLLTTSLLNVLYHAQWLGAAGADIPASLWRGYGWGTLPVLQSLGAAPQGSLSAFQVRAYETGLLGIILFYLPVFAVLPVYIRNLFSPSDTRLMALGGLVVLALLFSIDILFSAHQGGFTVGLTGWCCLSLFCVTRKYGTRKVYRLYQ